MPSMLDGYISADILIHSIASNGKYRSVGNFKRIEVYLAYGLKVQFGRGLEESQGITP